MKNEEIAGAQQGRSDPMVQGFNHIQRLLAKYPSDDVRYVPTTDEQIERLKNVSLDQVRTLYNDYLGAEHGEVVVVGDFDASAILPILSKTFDGWKSEKPYAWIERHYQPELEPKRETVATPDKENAIYIAGQIMPMRDDDPDYPALALGNFVLGGGALSSRIADRLRQQGGLSYTAMSMLQASPVDRRSNFLVLAIYNPDNVAKVATGVREELTRLLKDGVKTDELEKAKAGYLQSRLVMRTTDAMLAMSLAENLFLGRTMQFHADLEEKIKKLAPQDVERRLPQAHRPQTTVCGHRGRFRGKEIASGLERANPNHGRPHVEFASWWGDDDRRSSRSADSACAGDLRSRNSAGSQTHAERVPTSDVLEPFVGIAEPIELDAHAIHDRQVHRTKLAVVVALARIVEDATRRERSAQAACEDNRQLAGVVLGAGPHARGEEQARVVEHRAGTLGHGLQARGEIRELADVETSNPLVRLRRVAVRGGVMRFAHVEKRVKESRDVAAQ